MKRALALGAWIAVALGGAIALGKIALYRGEADQRDVVRGCRGLLLPGRVPVVLRLHRREIAGTG